MAKGSVTTKVLNQRYSLKSKGSTRRISSNGHCPDSPCGAHWWLIEPPTFKTSQGRCRYCGEEREFLNYIQLEFNEREKGGLLE